MNIPVFLEQFPGAITLCDTEGTIVYQNVKARAAFARFGDDLIGRSLEACHKPESWAKVKAMLQAQSSNIYTIEKAGMKKIIHQLPWRENDEFCGLIELSMEIPAEMPHFVRE